MRTKTFFNLLGVALLGFLVTTKIQAEELKMGYVDVEKVFNQYEKTKQNDEILKEKAKQKTAERAEFLAEINKNRQELELLSEQGQKEKQALIDEKIKNLKKFDEETKAQLRKERDDALKVIFDDIKGVIEAYGQTNGYTYILNERALLYKREADDLTKLISEELNKKGK